MKALDTNVIVRFLVNDDKVQARRARALLQKAEDTGDALFVTTPVVLEIIWVLSAAYDFTHTEILRALEWLAGMPILEFEDYDGLQQLIGLRRETRAGLPDLLIGLTGRRYACEATVTFEKHLAHTGLFEQM